jgi:hypothetical protein
LDQGACSGNAGHAGADDGDFECHGLDSTRLGVAGGLGFTDVSLNVSRLCLEYFVFRVAQGEQKGLGATPRFALYVVRTKPLVLALLLG